MIKVLQIFGKLDQGGAENLITSIFKKIDRNKIMFDALILSDEKGFLEDEWRALGANIYRIKKYNILNALSFKKELRQFFNNHKNEYQYVYNNTELSGPIIARVAKEFNIKNICHAHSSSSGKGIKGILRKLEYKKYHNLDVDHLFACSTMASKDRYGNRYKEATIINNSIDINKYKFNEEIRNEVRKELNIPTNAFLIGHVGRFAPVKNHSFIISLFNKYHKENPSSYLLLVGDGEQKENIKNLINDYNLNDYVILTGNTLDTYKYYNALDLFIMPSLFEGIPLVSIEAQANGLPLILSNNIDENVKLNDNVMFLPLDLSIWLNNIDTLKRTNNLSDKLNDYDINKLIEFYNNLFN